MRRSRSLSLPALAVLLLAPPAASAQAALTPTTADRIESTTAPLRADGVRDAALRSRRAERLAEQPTVAASLPTAIVADDAPARRLDAEDFAAGGFAQFMASPAGRIVRVVAGSALIVTGLNADSDAGTAVAVVGVVPLLAGAFDFCVLSPLFGGPFWGRDIRAAK